MIAKHQKVTAVCLVLLFYSAMILSFVLSEMEKWADDEKIRKSGWHINFDSRFSYWDIVGISFFIVATITAISTFRHFRHQNLTPLNLND